MRCPWDSTSKPSQCPSRAQASSLDPSASCTQTTLPKCFIPVKLGGLPYSACQGVIPPSARVDVRFFNHVAWRRASPHMFRGRCAVYSNAWTFSNSVWLRRSAIPFNCRESWTVSQRTVPASARCLLNSSLRYLLPRSNRKTLITVQWPWVSAQASNRW